LTVIVTVTVIGIGCQTNGLGIAAAHLDVTGRKMDAPAIALYETLKQVDAALRQRRAGVETNVTMGAQ
jgi:hypothetical protein